MSTAIPTILVIEDSEEDFAMIERALGEATFKHTIKHLITAGQVKQWLAESNPSASFILMDLNLPGGSGVNLIKAFRTHDAYRHTPIAILSTSSNSRDIDQSYKNGVNAYHVKPLETPHFLALVNRIAYYWFIDVLMSGNASKVHI